MPTTRTPEGWPVRCAVCSAAYQIELSDPLADAPCPSCGSLWRPDSESERAVVTILPRLPDEEQAILKSAVAKMMYADDSLGRVEGLMDLEEYMATGLPDVDYRIAQHCDFDDFRQLILDALANSLAKRFRIEPH